MGCLERLGEGLERAWKGFLTENKYLGRFRPPLSQRGAKPTEIFDGRRSGPRRRSQTCPPQLERSARVVSLNGRHERSAWTVGSGSDGQLARSTRAASLKGRLERST